MEVVNQEMNGKNSNKNKKILIVVLVVAILLLGGLFAYKYINSRQKKQVAKEAPAAEDLADSFKYEALVSAGKNGFIPTTLSVREHTRVFWKAEAGFSGSFKVVVTPGEDNEDKFGSEVIDPGNGYAHSFHKAGRYKYHDSLNPTFNGEIIVIADK